MDELKVLSDQLDEMLSSDVVDIEEALEVCQVAGMIARLDAFCPALTRAVKWRDGEGAEFVEEGWDYFDAVEILDSLDAASSGDLDDHGLEELLFDVDEAVAAAVWCGQQQVVRELAREVARAIRQVPEHFAAFGSLGAQMTRQPAVGTDQHLYDFWFALADARSLADSEK
jgi:hypothetical protein